MTEMEMNMDQPTPGGISRRRVLQGAAWSVPAVMVAQLPVWATTGTLPEIVVTIDGQVCKFPGNATAVPKGNVFSLTVTNTSDVPIEVDIDQMTVGGIVLDIAYLIQVDSNTPTCTDLSLDNPITVPANTALRVAVITQDYGSSPSTTVTVSYSWDSGLGVDDAGVASVSFEGDPWTGGCRPFAIDQGLWDASATCQNF